MIECQICIDSDRPCKDCQVSAYRRERAREVKCTKPPLGWECTRGYHPDGPCAAIPVDLYGGDRLYEFCDKYRHGTISVSGMTEELKKILTVKALCLTADEASAIVPLSELARIGVTVL